MNKLKFVEFIRKPSNLTAKNIDEISQVIEKYPYFQNARIILAKGSKIKELPETNQRISTAAIYATNRILLKKYLNDELIFLRSLEVQESIDKSVTKTVSTDEKPIKKDEKVEILEEDSIAEEETTNEVENVQIEKKVDRTEPVADKEILTNSTSKVEEEHSDLDDLISDIWKDIEDLRKSKARLNEIEKRMEEDEAFDSALKRATQKSAPKKSSPEKKVAVKKTTPVKKPDVEKPASPTAKKTITKKPASTVKKPVAKKSSRTTTPKPDETQESSKKNDKSDPKILQRDIIEKFISAAPSMPSMNKGAVPQVTSEDLSKASTALNNEIASEYLAEIFLEQGKKERAVEIYQTLSLKFPEKKSYFASLIKKLK